MLCRCQFTFAFSNNSDDTIRQLYSNKMLVKSIFLGVQHRQLNKVQTKAGISIIMLIMIIMLITQTADFADFADVINLSTPFLQLY